MAGATPRPAQVRCLAAIRLIGNNLSHASNPQRFSQVNRLRGPIVGPPRVLDDKVFPSDGIGNSPACGASTSDIRATEERFDAMERVVYFGVVGPTALHNSADFASVLNPPLDTGIKTNVVLVR